MKCLSNFYFFINLGRNDYLSELNDQIALCNITLFVHSTQSLFSRQCSLHENLLWIPQLCICVCLLQICVHSDSVRWKINTYWRAGFSHVFLSHAWMLRLHSSVDGCINLAEKHLLFYWTDHTLFAPPSNIRLLFKEICRPLKQSGPYNQLPSSEWWKNITSYQKLTCISTIGHHLEPVAVA